MAPLAASTTTNALLKQLTIHNVRRLLDSRLISCVDLAQFCLSMKHAGEEVWQLHAYMRYTDCDKSVLDLANEADARLFDNSPKSILDGIPVSIKANIAVREKPLTAGSKILMQTAPSSTPPVGYDADVTQIILRHKGAILTGVTTMDEFGMGSLGRKECKNPLPLLQYLQFDSPQDCSSVEEALASLIQMPQQIIMEGHEKALHEYQERHDPDMHYSAGGSSCGSAVSVAHGAGLLSMGTDTGGSVRLPAAWCGLYGMKPSYGLLSRHGVVSYASSFDTVGILAKSPMDAATALDSLAQRDAEDSRDSTFSSYNSTKHPLMEISLAQSADTTINKMPLQGVKIGIPDAFSVQECPAGIANAWSNTAERLEELGATIVSVDATQISPTIIQNALSAYYVLTSAEASSNLSRYDGFRYGGGEDDDDDYENRNSFANDDYTPLEREYATTRSKGFGQEVARRILCGTSVLSSDRFHTYYEAAALLRAQLAEQLHQTLEKTVDVILIPTVLSLPPQQNVDGSSMDSTAMFANDVMTTPASLAGLPATSIPVALEEEKGSHNHASAFKMCGMQLISGRLNEATLLQCAQALEENSRQE